MRGLRHRRLFAVLALAGLAGCSGGAVEELARGTAGNLSRVDDAMAGSVTAARDSAARRMTVIDYLTSSTLDGRARLQGELGAREAAGDDTFRRYELMRKQAAAVLDAFAKSSRDTAQRRAAISDGQTALEERVAGIAPVTEGLHALGETETPSQRFKLLFAFFKDVALKVQNAQAAKPAITEGASDAGQQ